MRGKLEVKEFKSTATRIIPAHAGQTSTLGMTVVRPSDHPRACGANLFDSSSSTHAVGSSPRMRGKRRFSRSTRRDGRIIPAHAGQTRRDISTSGRSPDHPRACGANGKISSKTMVRTGSSPRMRGKLRVERGRDDKIRIIPAHAGQTHGRRYMADRTPDHPRACGANSTKYNARHMPTGSSPRMRGKPLRFLVFDPCGRIIPAHAGQTRARSRRPYPPTDHPRACGANPNTVIPVTATAGSSPRMRGKLQRYLQYIR